MERRREPRALPRGGALPPAAQDAAQGRGAGRRELGDRERRGAGRRRPALRRRLRRPAAFFMRSLQGLASKE